MRYGHWATVCGAAIAALVSMKLSVPPEAGALLGTTRPAISVRTPPSP